MLREWVMVTIATGNTYEYRKSFIFVISGNQRSNFSQTSKNSGSQQTGKNNNFFGNGSSMSGSISNSK